MATSVWKGNITIAGASIPAKLVAAARKHESPLAQIHAADGLAVKMIPFCASEDRRLIQEEIAKGVETEPGRFLAISPDDLKALNAPPGDMAIDGFAKRLDPLRIESSYYVIPDGDEEPYAALFSSLALTSLYAFGQVTLYGHERTIVMKAGRTGVVLFTLFADEELRGLNEFRTAAGTEPRKGAAKLASFMRKQRAEDVPPIDSPYRRRLAALIEAKKAATATQVQPGDTNRSELRAGTPARSA